MDLTGLRKPRSIAVFWSFFAAIWFFLGSGLSSPLAVWDEQIYFNAARNVLEGRWLIPKISPGTNPLGGMDPFLEKPPLTYWVVAMAMAIGGETPLVGRIPSLLAMSGVIGITVLLACRLSRPAAGVFTGSVALGIPAFSLTRGAADVATDPFLMLFGTGAIYCLVVFVQTEQNQWAWIAGFGYGAAILSKFIAAAPFGLFTLFYLYRYRDRIELRGFSRVVAGGVIVAAPWFVIVAYLEPQALLNQMFLDQVVGRATGENFGVTGQPLFAFMNYPYLQDLRNYFGWPIIGLVFAMGASLGRKRLLNTVSDVDTIMWPFAIGVIMLYTVGGGNHQWYVMPAAVPISILVGDAIAASLTPILENLDFGEIEGSQQGR